MYFWKIENLKEDIRTKQLTEKDRFIYMFTPLIIYYLMITISMLVPSKGANTLEIVYHLSDVLIIFLGTILAFRANGGAMGVDFLGKYFSISFVVYLRFIPLLILIIIITVIIDFVFPVLNTNFILYALSLIWGIAVYWRIIKHIRDVK